MSRFVLFGALIDFDGDGKVNESDCFLGTLFSDIDKDSDYDPVDPDEAEGDDDPYDVRDYFSTEEFYEDHPEDFSSFEDAEDYFDDWN